MFAYAYAAQRQTKSSRYSCQLQRLLSSNPTQHHVNPTTRLVPRKKQVRNATMTTNIVSNNRVSRRWNSSRPSVSNEAVGETVNEAADIDAAKEATSKKSMLSAEITRMTNSTTLHSSSYGDSAALEQSLADSANRLNIMPSTINTDAAAQQPRKSARELLAAFNPLSPPKFATDGPATPKELEQLQLWIECQSQQEAVEKYQAVLDSARNRRDYGSLDLVQKQVVRWLPALQKAMEKMQSDYLVDPTDERDAPTGRYRKAKRKRENRSETAYGPKICSLSAEKLAVITAHEALLFLCTAKAHPRKMAHSKVKMKSTKARKQNSTAEANNDTVKALVASESSQKVTLTTLAFKLGEAVENELILHRVLYKRHLKQKQKNKIRKAAKEAKSENSLSDPEANSLEQNVSDTMENGIADLFGPDADTDSDIDGQEMMNWTYAQSHLRSLIDETNNTTGKRRHRASYSLRKARRSMVDDAGWSMSETIQLGAALFHALAETSTVIVNGKPEPAFTLHSEWMLTNKIQSFASLNSALVNTIMKDKLVSINATTTRSKPMIVEPVPWTSATSGGYLMLRTELMRYHGSHTQREALQASDNTVVLDALNALGRVKWRINKAILDVAQKCREDDIPLGDIASSTDFDVLEEPTAPEYSTERLEKDSPEYNARMKLYHTYREKLQKHQRLVQKNMDLRSSRCSASLKLDQAEKFKEFDQIYFPYNMDFRGRAYPVPPHLSNVGSDLCRGMLMFAESKPLGPRGLYWLKVHLANLSGNGKMSFDDRIKFVDDNMDNVRASVVDPFAGDRWWMSLEDPFQGLATCREICAAIDSGNPETYSCPLPVHMDGSCNGLQHYAALGLDRGGGLAVNLCNAEVPQDVYVGVMHEVNKRVHEEAQRTLDFDVSEPKKLNTAKRKQYNNNRYAKLLDGMIDRGVVKRTVMTSVYGVTYIGARTQIMEKIEDKLESQGYDVDAMDQDVFQACGYVAAITMEVIGDLFSGARETMNWLTSCARLITRCGYPVAWISPIGLPAIQPYRQKKTMAVITVLQAISLTTESDQLPIHKARQVTAFPPNYIHSLDSSHMFLTALEMDRRGLAFSAVHDSYWTHACDVDEMNVALRDTFVELYSQPLLKALRDSWEMRYPNIEFPPLPETGTLDLEEVKRSRYFFQ